MAAFEHITTLLSFIFALALTHLLASATDLVLARERVRFSWVQTLWMVNAMVLLLNNWLSLWDDRALAHWDIASITLQFSFAVLQYFTCSLVSPKVPEDGPFDMWAFAQAQRKYYLGAVAALGVAAAFVNVYFAWKRQADFMQTLAGQVFLIPIIAIVLAGALVRSATLQLLFALLFLLSAVGTLLLLTTI